MHAASILFLLGASCQNVASFQTLLSTTGCSTCIQAERVSHPHESDSGGAAAINRRSFAESLLKGSIGFSLANLTSAPAHASGGATAGGAYLLSGGLDLYYLPLQMMLMWTFGCLLMFAASIVYLHIANLEPVQQNNDTTNAFSLVWNHSSPSMQGEILDEHTCVFMDVPSPKFYRFLVYAEIWMKWTLSLSRPKKADGKI